MANEKYLDYEGLKSLISKLYNGDIQVGKALKDASGNIISETYITIDELSGRLDEIVKQLGTGVSGEVDQESLRGIYIRLNNLESETVHLNSGVIEISGVLYQHIKDYNSLSGNIFDMQNQNSITSRIIANQQSINQTNTNLENNTKSLSGGISTNTKFINEISGKIFGQTPSSIVNQLNETTIRSQQSKNLADTLSGQLYNISGTIVNINKKEDELSGKIILLNSQQTTNTSNISDL